MRASALEVRDLRVELAAGEAIVDSLDLTVARGEILGLVGESGSGKTTAALAVLGYAKPGGRITAGAVVVAGESV
ncbi:MAG: ATP-binding cassette domain-containing protein, partial [Thermoleophilaceae bacterium]